MTIKDLAWSKIWKDNSQHSYWKEQGIAEYLGACPNCHREDRGTSWICRQCKQIICMQCLEGTLIEKDNKMVCQTCKSKFQNEVKNE